MSRAKKMPDGNRPILNPGIARTRYAPMFATQDGRMSGQFYELAEKVGVTLQLPPGRAPYLLPGESLVGTYATGRTFAVNKAALFTNTSKMPGPSFAIPAGPPNFGGTCPAAALGENYARSVKILEERTGIEIKTRSLPVLGDSDSGLGAMTPGVLKSYDGDPSFVCRSCYALNGNYNYPSKQVNDMMHLAWIRHELAQGGPERLGTALAYAIQHVNITRKEGFQPYFRIHDAGDFDTPEYLQAWVHCASLMKHMRFWAPTRQWVFPKWVKLLRSAMVAVREAGGWLVIRPSVLDIGDEIPALDGLPAGSGVSAPDPCAFQCPVYNKLIPTVLPDGTPAMTEAVSCIEANCTMCWDQPSIPVSYGAH